MYRKFVLSNHLLFFFLCLSVYNHFMNSRINIRSSLRQLSELSPEMASLVPHLVVFGDFPVNEDITLDANGPKQGELLCSALEYLESCIKKGVHVIENCYSEQEIAEKKAKAKTSLMYIPAFSSCKKNRTVFVTSGGAFMGVYNLFEGVSCGYTLASMGYDVFVVTYRVCRFPVVDNAMEDIACSFKYVQNHGDFYDVNLDGYMFMGFSAGGHLAGIWATRAKGSLSFGIDRPSALILGYPALSTIDFLEDMEAGRYTPGHSKVLRLYLNLIAGRNSGRDLLSPYSVELNLDEDYPPTYIIQCKDDDKVNCSTVLRMEQSLKANGITHMIRFEETGGHGFGTADDKPFALWLKEAVTFLDK